MNTLSYIVWNPDETICHIGGLALRWYGMCWFVGLTLGYLLMQRLYKEQKLGADKFEPLFIYVFVSILLGARWVIACSMNPAISSARSTTSSRCSSRCATLPTEHGSMSAIRGLRRTAA